MKWATMRLPGHPQAHARIVDCFGAFPNPDAAAYCQPQLLPLFCSCSQAYSGAK